MFCTKCGNRMDEGAKFCGRCGTAVVSQNTSQAQSAPVQTYAATIPAPYPATKASNKGKIIIASVILPVVVLIFVLVNRSGGDSLLSNISNPGESASIGDVVQFGDYDWRVLDIQDGKALLLSDKILEFRAYHTISEEITWEGSSIRRYLNGEFLSRFTTAEQELIMETRVVNSDNHWYGTAGGAATTDRVFLLSLDEVVRYLGDGGQLRNRPSSDKHWIDDEYNQARIAYQLEDLHGQVPQGMGREGWEILIEALGGASYWWLRSPGDNSNYAAYVAGTGGLMMHGNYVHLSSGGVRPVMWLNLQC